MFEARQVDEGEIEEHSLLLSLVRVQRGHRRYIWNKFALVSLADVVKHVAHSEVLHAGGVEVARIATVLATNVAGGPGCVGAGTQCVCVDVDPVGEEWDELGRDGNEDGLGT